MNKHNKMENIKVEINKKLLDFKPVDEKVDTLNQLPEPVKKKGCNCGSRGHRPEK